jgi:acetolactate synthase-1/2/3 large subunit
MSEKKIRGGSLIARALKDKGIQHVFTLSGGFCNPALEGFMECQMEVINCPHEQVAGHIADGILELQENQQFVLLVLRGLQMLYHQ